MIKEFCAENFTNIPNAIASGANRIELCDNLAVGGTTVSKGVMVETLAYCSEKQVPVRVIIRPRGGNFIYTDTEIKIMEADIYEAKQLGVDGIVIGCLNENNWIDEEAMNILLDAADGLQVTFHMAFDQMNREDQFKAIDWLSERHVDRILTHGGMNGTPIEKNLEYINDLISYANNRIILLPGGGIDYKNVDSVVSFLQVKEVHGTKIVELPFS
ncbi:copper homeostasis protein CutC [Vagococcus carniphilus]|uniref:PF03932 family protein CutC n=1 Tax=Vagococcus carniphilus TaxID=218144 RepID=A0AAW8U9A8_9ENTE|nr:copper homeostasis protein CutC [Vagococcus carniphilus]MDT2829926.1 copper homeostasis protein CutC [Vagococcus carniphilus]MDT2834780.1 copper homeostasis protein CutC [Vagococcus carniphilus]MDT2838360.1 copper homeostasis protein CutC [Vagococcus carniphilus]MDT2849678.1 copper homeostasis protein CutC [Vagococcus carniphilus]MDT2854356.1 copper homeostasis protein CutC [Vagococcus carniphilus]